MSGIEHVLADVRRGRPVILTGGDLSPGVGGALIVAAADLASTDEIKILTRLGHGRLYLALTAARCEQLGLRPLARDADRWTHDLMTSIDARDLDGVGVSAADRASTVRAAVDAAASRSWFTSPGHVFPVRADDGGSLVRAGQAEAAVDIARLAGLRPAAVMADVLTEAGRTAESDRVRAVADSCGLACVSVEAIVAHRRATERVIEPVASAVMPTAVGEFRVVGFRDCLSGRHHVGLIRGELAGCAPLVAVEYECRLGTALRATACSCRARQLDALRRIGCEGRGAFLQLSRSARARSVLVSCDRYPSAGDAAPTAGVDAFPEWSDSELTGGLLRALGIGRVRLLTSRPIGDDGLGAFGIEVVERLAHCTPRAVAMSAP